MTASKSCGRSLLRTTTVAACYSGIGRDRELPDRSGGTRFATVPFVHPIERRHPKVSVQDLRRDLREADEDRYRLLVRTGDWRHPRVGVQEIRRQLREADE